MILFFFSLFLAEQNKNDCLTEYNKKKARKNGKTEFVDDNFWIFWKQQHKKKTTLLQLI